MATPRCFALAAPVEPDGACSVASAVSVDEHVNRLDTENALIFADRHRVFGEPRDGALPRVLSVKSKIDVHGFDAAIATGSVEIGANKLSRRTIRPLRPICGLTSGASRH